MNTGIVVVTPKNDEHVNLIEAAKRGLRGELTELSWSMYETAINSFLDFLKTEDTSQFGGSVAVAFSSYLKHLSTLGYKPSTINAKKSSLRRFFQWAVTVGWIDSQTLIEIQQIKSPKGSGGKAGQWLTLPQMQQVLDSPDTTTLLGKRDKILLALLLGCALRRSEVVKLTFGHFSKQGDTWVILNLSRKHHRVQPYIPVPNWVMEIITEHGVWGADDDHVLSSYDKHGNARGTLSADAVWRIVTSYTERLGFKGCGPHDFRRSWSREARKHGLEVTQIQGMLGHSSVATTQKYIAEIMEVDKVASAVELNTNIDVLQK